MFEGFRGNEEVRCFFREVEGEKGYRINLGGQCKSLKSTSRLLDHGSDVGSDVGSDHFGQLGISFLTSLNQQLFRNIAYVWYSWHFNKAVFVNFYFCICVFVYL